MSSQQDSENPTGPETAVWKLMTRAVARISPDSTLHELAHKLAAVEAGALAVGTTEAIVGIVSERDLTRAYGLAESSDEMSVGDISSSAVIWCDPDTTATDAATLMSERGVRHLLVGDGSSGDLQGIVSARDLIDALVGR